MNKLIGRLVLLAVLVLAAVVYYLKYPDVRTWVDTNAPAVKQAMLPVVAQWDAHFPPAVPTPAAAPPASDTATADATTPAPAAPQTASPSTAAAIQGVPAPQSNVVDLAQLSQSRAEWPKTLTLKKDVEFPAVLDGKVVGSVKAPAGTQALLIVIKGNQAGVEYQGGGAMVDIADTDLIERVQSSRHAGVAVGGR